MFCGKCGANVPEGAAFCKNCGEPMAKSNKKAAVRSKKQNKAIGVTVVILAAIVLLILLLGKPGYKTTVNTFMDAMLEADAKALLSVLPDDVIDSLMDELWFDTDERKEFTAYLQDTLEAFSEDHSDYKISYKIDDTIDLSAKELKELNAEYEDIGLKMTEAKEADITVTIRYDGDTEHITTTIPLIKTDGKWYIDLVSFDDLIYGFFYEFLY